MGSSFLNQGEQVLTPDKGMGNMGRRSCSGFIRVKPGGEVERAGLRDG